MNIFQGAWSVSKWRLNINTQQVCCNLCQFQNGNGKSFPWTPLEVCHGLGDIMILSWLWWTGWQRHPILYRLSLRIRLMTLERYSWRIHGFPKAIVFDIDVKFTSNVWKGLFSYLGTNVNFSTSYHPQTDGQTERVNQVLEDMFCMYVMDKPTKWEDYLHLV